MKNFLVDYAIGTLANFFNLSIVSDVGRACHNLKVGKSQVFCTSEVIGITQLG